MSYRINKARKLQQDVLILEQEIKLNARVLEAAEAARSEKHIVDDLAAKDRKLKKKLEKVTKRFYAYADENLKISDLTKLNEEEVDDPFEDEDYFY